MKDKKMSCDTSSWPPKPILLVCGVLLLGLVFTGGRKAGVDEEIHQLEDAIVEVDLDSNEVYIAGYRFEFSQPIEYLNRDIVIECSREILAEINLGYEEAAGEKQVKIEDRYVAVIWE